MSFNRSLLTAITKDLEKKKKPSKPKVPRNQWQHPGEITKVNSPNITMEGVSYPVLGVPNVGPAQMMYPDEQYHFPGAGNVVEYPQMMQDGGKTNEDPMRRQILNGLDKGAAYALKGAKWVGKTFFGTDDVVPDFVKEAIYNRIRPVSYPTDLTQVVAEYTRSKRAKPTKDLQGDPSMDEEAWSRVLRRPTKSKYFIPAENRPSNATDPNAQYWKMAPGVVDEQLMKSVLNDSYFSRNGKRTKDGLEYVEMHGLEPFMNKKFMKNYNKYAQMPFDQTDPLSNYQVFRGVDKKTGKPYLSIKDTYDFGLESANEMIQPMNIYHRIYRPGGSTVASSDATRVAAPALPLTKKQLEINKAINRQVMVNTQKAEEVARFKEIQDRRNRIAVSNLVQPHQWQSPQNFAVANSAIGDKLRVSEEPNFFDDYINPAAFFGHLASGLGQVPLNIQQGNYRTAAMNIASPLVAGTAETVISPLIEKATKATRKGFDQTFTKTGRQLAEWEAYARKKGLTEQELKKAQMMNVGITSMQREAYVPGISEIASEYITPYGYNKPLKRVLDIPRRIIKGEKNSKNLTDVNSLTDNELLAKPRYDAWRLYSGLPQKNGTFRIADTSPINHPSYTSKQLSNLEKFSLNGEKDLTLNLPDVNDMRHLESYPPEELADSLLYLESSLSKLNEKKNSGIDIDNDYFTTNVMGGFNRRFFDNKMQYNDIWDLDLNGTKVEKYFGKPFLSHGHVDYSFDPAENLLKDYINKARSFKESAGVKSEPLIFETPEMDNIPNQTGLNTSKKNKLGGSTYSGGVWYDEGGQTGWLEKYQPGGDTVAYADNTRVGNVPRYTRPGNPYAHQPVSLQAADVLTDLMQLGHFIPHPIAQEIAAAGDLFGAGIDGVQAADAFTNGNYGEGAINVAGAVLPSFIKSKGYLRDMHNTKAGSLAERLAKFGSKDGNYRPLTSLPHLINNPVIRKGLKANKAAAGVLGAETVYDNFKGGGTTYSGGLWYDEGGQTEWLDKYQEGGKTYQVKAGQYLSQIAKENNVSVDDLVLANKINNPNLIKPGQNLVIPENANTFRMPSKDGYVGFNDLMARQEKLSSLPAQELVKQFRSQNQVPGNYAIVDKKSGRLSVFDPSGKELSSIPVGTGKDVGDKVTINTKGPSRRNSTPAGIFTLKNKGTGRDSYAKHYGDNIWEMLDQNGVQQATALHQVPNEMQFRNAIIGDNDPTNNRISNGCINCRKPDFDRTIEKYLGKGNQVYVLPEDDNNKFVVKNNKIMLTGSKFDPDVAYSKKDLNAKPIQIKYAKSDFGDTAPAVQKMAQSLVNQKQALMKDLNIDNDTYNELAQLTLGVAGQESNYGDSWKYKYKESPQGQNDVKALKHLSKLFSLEDPTHISPNSRGFTQIKYDSQNKDVRNLFAKYGIKSADDLADPSKSTIGALIMMGYMHNNELPQLKSQMEKLGVSKKEAILYLNQGKRSELTKGTATPDKNKYIQNVKKFGNRFVFNQKAQDGGMIKDNWLDKYN